jgi:predicted ATPase/DNA-binding SARP family transcriptional activator
MDIRVLGALEVDGDDGRVRLPAAKLRQVLAALLVQLGETRSADALIEAVWGESPPASARKLLQVYISQLRKLLPDDVRIVTREAGYGLELKPESLDAVRFERLLREGNDALREGNAALASSLLGRALALWRGPAYGDFAYDDFARAEAARLEELRLVAHEEWTEARLRLGRHLELLGELRALSAALPLRERIQAQMMLALYRCGRQSEALEVYATTRLHLRNVLGLEPGPELRELQRRILQQDPGLDLHADLGGEVSVLPAAPKLLLGRERELEELQALLQRPKVRLLVLIGAGGSGKTRLALEAASGVASLFANGAALVELAPIRDPDLVAATIARALAIAEVPDQEPLETIATVLRPRELLLVVDNIEHLQPAASLLVGLLAAAPRLKLLVTSRVVLHVSGEHVYPVEPLPAEAARALFVERAQAAEPRLRPEVADEETIDRICERLDRLPLAIELAAGWIRALTLAELHARLDARLPLLIGGSRDLPARQQTLLATVEWSFHLLEEHEQRDLTRLSVFAGTCTLEAAEVVCETTLERLSSLVDHNLLRHLPSSRGSRYAMLDTIREYALKKLEASGEAREVGRRQLEFLIALAENANLFAEAEGPQRQELVIPEYENAHAAIGWALQSGDIELGLRLAVLLENFWATRDAFEGMRVFAQLLEAEDGVPPALRARALRAYASSAHRARQLEQAQALYEESFSLHHALGDERGAAILRYRLGLVALDLGNLDQARPLLEDALDEFRRLESRRGEAQTVGVLGSLAKAEGNLDLAAELFEESATMCAQIGRRWWMAEMLAELADLALVRGDVEEAADQARQALAVSHAIGDRTGIVRGLGYLACAAAARDDPNRAGRLWGAIEGEEARGPIAGWGAARELCHTRMSEISCSDLERGLKEGRELSLAVVVAEELRSSSVSSG